MLHMHIPTVSAEGSILSGIDPFCLESSQLFLEQIVAIDQEAIHIVIWDRAGFHHTPKASDVPSHARLLPLPPYCPELNPMEKLWDIVKRHTSNKIFETLTLIESQITDVLKPFWENAQRVFGLLGDNWLTRGVATFMSQRKALETPG